MAVCVVWFGPRSYSAETTVFAAARPTEPDSTSALDGTDLAMKRLATYAALVTSRRTAEEIADELQIVSADDVAGALSASIVPDTLLLTVSATDTSPERAAAIANVAAQRLLANVAELEQPLGGQLAPVSPQIFRAATPPTAPDPSNVLFVLAIGTAAGAVVALGIAIARRILGRHAKSPRWLGIVTGVPILGVLNPAAGVDPVRYVRVALQAAVKRDGATAIMIAGTSPRDDDADASRDLAMAIAETGTRVLLIEADLRQPDAPGARASDQDPGLADLLLGRKCLRDVARDVGEFLDLLTPGSNSKRLGQLVGGPRMIQLVEEARGSYDLVLIHAAPLPATSTLALASHTDGVVLVVARRWDSARRLHTGRASLDAVSAPILGAVLMMRAKRSRRPARIEPRSADVSAPQSTKPPPHASTIGHS